MDGALYVVSGERDGTTRFWTFTGTTLAAGPVVRAGRSQINALAVAQRHEQPAAVSADADGSIRIWDVVRGQLVKEHATGSSGGLNAIAVAGPGPGGLIITGGADGLVQSWDLDLKRAGDPLAGHRHGVHTLTVIASSENIAIVSGGADETLHAWRRDGRAWLAGPPVRHRHGVRALAVAEPGGKRPVVLSAGGDSRVRAWDLSDLMSRDISSARDGRAVRAVAATTVDGRPVVIAAGDDGIVTALDASSGAFLAHGPASHRLAVRALAVADRAPSPLVVSTGDDETMRLWEFGAATATTVVTSGVLTCAVIFPELSVLAVGGEDGRVRLCRPADGSARGESVKLHEGRVTALAAINATGRTAFVSAGADGELRLSYLDSKREALLLAEHNSQVRAICVVGSDNDAKVASGGDDGIVRLWGLPGGRMSGRELPGRHQGAVTALAAVGGGGLDSASATVVSGGQDGILFVRTPEELRLIETGSPVTSLAALGDGVIVGTESGLLSLRFPR